MIDFNSETLEGVKIRLSDKVLKTDTLCWKPGLHGALPAEKR